MCRRDAGGGGGEGEGLIYRAWAARRRAVGGRKARAARQSTLMGNYEAGLGCDGLGHIRLSRSI